MWVWCISPSWPLERCCTCVDKHSYIKPEGVNPLLQRICWFWIAQGPWRLVNNYCFCSVTVMSNSLRPHGLQHTRFPCPSLSPRVCSNSCASSWWCHPTISSSVTLFSSCLQSFPVSESLPISQLFASGSQSIGASTSASFLPVNIQGWFPLELTGLISLLSKGLSRVFSSTTIWKHQFFSAQPSLWCNSHIIRDNWRNHSFD